MIINVIFGPYNYMNIHDATTLQCTTVQVPYTCMHYGRKLLALKFETISFFK